MGLGAASRIQLLRQDEKERNGLDARRKVMFPS